MLAPAGTEIDEEKARIIKDAGIDKNEIGAVLCAQHIMGNEYNTEAVFGRLPEAIGAKNCKITCMTSSGGASSFSIRKTPLPLTFSTFPGAVGSGMSLRTIFFTD